MGAWGTGIFESDAALDFVLDVIETTDLTPINAALTAINTLGAEYLEVDLAEQGLVAAEVIAALNGHPGDLPDNLAEWLADKNASAAESPATAHHAVTRVLTNSELRELWEEAEDDFAAWEQGIQALLARLVG